MAPVRDVAGKGCEADARVDVEVSIEDTGAKTPEECLADMMNIARRTGSTHAWLSVTTTLIVSGDTVSYVSSEWTHDKLLCLNEAMRTLAERGIDPNQRMDPTQLQVVTMTLRPTSQMRIYALVEYVARWSADRGKVAVACTHTDETDTRCARQPVHMHVMCERCADEDLYDYFRTILKARH